MIENCPFCDGSECELFADSHESGGFTFNVYYLCKLCGARGPDIQNMTKVGDDHDPFILRQAADAWNRRMCDV